MNHLDEMKIQDIVEKLHTLDCDLLGNKDDAWIMELLFKPGVHRFNLIEWIISKFGDNFELQKSAKNRIKNLKATLSAWGICQENNDDIVEGTAAVQEQLQFWSTLIDIMWMKYEITTTISMTDSDGVDLSPERSVRKHIFQKFKEVCSCIDKFCESDNMQHIFKCDPQLLAPDVERELMNLSSSKLELPEIPDPQKLNEPSKENNKQDVPFEIYKKLCAHKALVGENETDSSSEIELNKLEEELQKVSSDLLISEGAFNDVYNDLKPLILNAKEDNFVDVGPAFQKVEPLLEDFLKLNKSFPKLESTNFILSKKNSELEDLLNQDTFSDENYTKTYKLLEDKS